MGLLKYGKIGYIDSRKKLFDVYHCK